MRIEATLRLKNYELISRRLKAGYKTQIEFAAAIGIAPATVSAYEGFRAIPKHRRITEKIEQILDCEITAIFPPYLKEITKKLALPRRRIVRFKELQPYMIGGLLPKGPDEAYELKELKKIALQPLENLTERERRLINLNFGLHGERAHTYREIGKIFHVGPERIRQIRAKALRKLKHPSAGIGKKVGKDFVKSCARMSNAAEVRNPERRGRPPKDSTEPQSIFWKPLCRPDCPVCGGIEYK